MVDISRAKEQLPLVSDTEVIALVHTLHTSLTTASPVDNHHQILPFA